MELPKKIYPSAEELSKINSTLYCPEDGCSSVFMSESNLNLHLVKTHKKVHLMQTDNIVKEYHCPELSCTYNTMKFFKNLKLLKQHYLKVHNEKTFGCDSCEMKFSTNAAKNSHIQYCGVQFNCCECTVSYPSYESLMTHGRRKKHKILDKALYKKKNTNIPCKSNSNTSIKSTKCKKEQVILPKGSTSLQLMNCLPISVLMLEKSSQTDICADVARKTKRTQIGKNLHYPNNSQQTQTLNKKKQRLTAETQTIGDYITKKPNVDVCEEIWSRKSIKTQTKPVASVTKSCNTSFNLDDFDFICDASVERNSSSTQTAIPNELFYSISTTTHDTIHTDTTDLNFEFMHSSSQTSFSEEMEAFDSENFFNCNSETQTDFMSMLNSDYCSNMCTQTCDDILLNDLGFNSSQTQTVLDDMLRSVESQTMMSSHGGTKVLLSCHMANMETQTDIEFKQLLEEINA